MHQDTRIGDLVHVLATDFDVVDRDRDVSRLDRADRQWASGGLQTLADGQLWQLDEVFAVGAPDRVNGGAFQLRSVDQRDADGFAHLPGDEAAGDAFVSVRLN